MRERYLQHHLGVGKGKLIIDPIYSELKYILLLTLSCLASQVVSAQLGGLNTYEFLNLPASARISGLGGNLITVRDDDANIALSNPAVLNASMHGQLSFNHSFHLAGTQNGYFNYAHHAGSIGTTFYAGVQYAAYGEIQEIDEFGVESGTVSANEYAIALGAGKEVYDRLAVGLSAKLITSQFGPYNSLGLVADLAAVYFDTSSNFTASIVFRNMGTQISTYREGNDEPLPFEIQVGFSKQLKYLPFRFSIIYHHLDRWNVVFDDPNSEETTLFFGEEPTEPTASSIWFDNFFRHFVFNGEFLFGKKENFRLRFGYNHFLRKELVTANFGGFAGFSLGVGFKVNRFRIDYGRTTYHIAGGVNHIGISTYLKEFK